MTKEEKGLAIEDLKNKISASDFFYVTDASTLTVAQVNKLRRVCFEKGVEIAVVKNTLVRKAMEALPAEKNYAAVYDALHGPTTIMFTQTANLPARIIKEFRGEGEKPAVKAAYIDSAVFFGDGQLDALTKLKDKKELIGDVIALLQSPMKNVISALNSGGQTISGLIKALENRG